MSEIGLLIASLAEASPKAMSRVEDGQVLVDADKLAKRSGVQFAGVA